MYRQLTFDFEEKVNEEGIHHAIDEISKEIEETTSYMRGILYEMKTLKMVDDIFDQLYK